MATTNSFTIGQCRCGFRLVWEELPAEEQGAECECCGDASDGAVFSEAWELVAGKGRVMADRCGEGARCRDCALACRSDREPLEHACGADDSDDEDTTDVWAPWTGLQAHYPTGTLYTPETAAVDCARALQRAGYSDATARLLDDSKGAWAVYLEGGPDLSAAQIEEEGPFADGLQPWPGVFVEAYASYRLDFFPCCVCCGTPVAWCKVGGAS